MVRCFCCAVPKEESKLGYCTVCKVSVCDPGKECTGQCMCEMVENTVEEATAVTIEE